MTCMDRIQGRLPKSKVIPSELYGKHRKNNWKSLYCPMWVLMSAIYFSSENVAVVEFLQHYLPPGLESLQDSFGLCILQISTADLNLYSLCFFFNVYQNWSILSHQPVLWSKHLSKPQNLHSAPRFKDLVSVKRKQHFGTKLPPVKLLKLKCLLKQTSLSYIMSDIWYPSHESQHCVSEVKSTEGLYLRVKQPSRNYGINEKWSDLR